MMSNTVHIEILHAYIQQQFMTMLLQMFDGNFYFIVENLTKYSLLCEGQTLGWPIVTMPDAHTYILPFLYI